MGTRSRIGILNKNGKVYEWENSEGVRFRLATDKTKNIRTM